MCRWFAYISKHEECLLEDCLIDPEHAISKQVESRYLPYLFTHEALQTSLDTEREVAIRNKFFNADGLGVAWYDNTRERFGLTEGEHPTIYKIVRQPLTDPNFMSICENTASTCIFSHIRFASPGTAITAWNAHPFRFGRYTFMHNGDLAHWELIKRPIINATSQTAYDLVLGTTDSEHLAALFFTSMSRRMQIEKPWEKLFRLRDLRAALEDTIRTVITLQTQVVTRDQFQASNINVALTDGKQLLTIRFRNHAREYPPSMYYSTKAGVDINHKYVGNPNSLDDDSDRDTSLSSLRGRDEYPAHVIVCSEPTTFREKDWNLVEKNTGIMVDNDMKVTKFNVDVSF